jgi:hypothetical protein
LQLHRERYKVLIVPPVEVIPYATLEKVKEFFNAGGVVLGYEFLPTKSATLGRDAKAISALSASIWGENARPGLQCCRTSSAGGRSYFLPEKPTSQQLQQTIADAGVRPTLEVLSGATDGWLHVLHRVKAEQDVFLVCNQNHKGAARRFRFRASAAGEPECWDAVRNELTAIPFSRSGDKQVEFTLSLEPLESVLLVFQPKRSPRPQRLEPGMKSIRESVSVVRDPTPPPAPLPPMDEKRPHTKSSVAAADPFHGHFAIPADVNLADTRVCLEMERLRDDSAAVSVNGTYVGGVIGRPLRLDISRHVKAGENAIVIEPLAPKAARIAFYRGAAASTEANAKP